MHEFLEKLLDLTGISPVVLQLKILPAVLCRDLGRHYLQCTYMIIFFEDVMGRKRRNFLDFSGDSPILGIAENFLEKSVHSIDFSGKNKLYLCPKISMKCLVQVQSFIRTIIRNNHYYTE